jgi:hypothetical protein
MGHFYGSRFLIEGFGRAKPLELEVKLLTVAGKVDHVLRLYGAALGGRPDGLMLRFFEEDSSRHGR